ncbi:hypothetical protein [Sphingobium fuliginis]|uniref:Uncharacterized protein n=1 Tax=Sphingobium fuliginis (strain ATCC 27551) TaxID=336203 RepID=A0A292ZN99_SPHSA|nr:hypothetical protein [Sphingobium fuliginis]GAY24353.1 hypothetical protein SFOMI_4933 [Sphingobium fuliginis]
MKRSPINGHQLALPLEQREAIEREIETRVAQRLKQDAWLWRFRLVTIEAIMMATLIVAAGILLGKTPFAIFRAAVMVAAACFGSGMILLGLSMGATHGWTAIVERFRRWRS